MFVAGSANCVAGTQGQWTFDSAATDHYCNDRSLFTVFQGVTAKVKFGAGTGTIRGMGDVPLVYSLNGVRGLLTLKNVAYVPEIRRNLI